MKLSTKFWWSTYIVATIFSWLYAFSLHTCSEQKPCILVPLDILVATNILISTFVALFLLGNFLYIYIPKFNNWLDNQDK